MLHREGARETCVLFFAPLLPCWEVVRESVCFLTSLFSISEMQVTMFTSAFYSISRSGDKNYEKSRYYPWPVELCITSSILPFLHTFPHTSSIPCNYTCLLCSHHPSLMGPHTHVLTDSLCEPGKHNSDTTSTSDCLEIETRNLREACAAENLLKNADRANAFHSPIIF